MQTGQLLCHLVLSWLSLVIQYLCICLSEGVCVCLLMYLYVCAHTHLCAQGGGGVGSLHQRGQVCGSFIQEAISQALSCSKSMFRL